MINMIVAVSRNGKIGNNNKMPWNIKEDLRYFKEITMGHTVVMGRKTFQSIGKALPNRKNIVLTRNVSFVADKVGVVHTMEEVLTLAKKETVFIIGGGEIYALFMPYVDQLYITEIEIEVEGDTDFPPYIEQFKKISDVQGEGNSNYVYHFTRWIRK